MSRYRILYTPEGHRSIRHLPPLVKSPIKLLIEKLADNPLLGKPLRSELAGYYSARFQRWRIIYVIDKPRHAVVIHLIEHRVSVYETLKTLSH